MVELQKRSEGVGIIKLAEYDEATGLTDFPISEATSAILHCDNKSILVGKITPAGNGAYVGRVYGFEPPGTIVPGLIEGEEIEFRQEHVISMSR